MNVRDQQCLHCDEKLKGNDVLLPLVGVDGRGNTVPVFVHFDCVLDGVADAVLGQLGEAGEGVDAGEDFNGQDFDAAKHLWNKVFGEEARERRGTRRRR